MLKAGSFKRNVGMHSKLVWKILTLTILLVVLVRPVSAHRPGWGEEGRITEIENISTSYAFYEELGAGEPQAEAGIAVTGENDLADQAQAGEGVVDIYAFEALAGQELYSAINIPALEGLEDYGVSLAVVGPGLPAADLDQLPLTAPQGMGTRVFPSQQNEDFFEPFTQTRYWGRQEISLNLPETGEYYLAVWNPDGLPGKYVLATGRAEVFGPLDFFRFPVWWLQVHLYYGHGLYLAAGLAALATLVMGAVWLRQRR